MNKNTQLSPATPRDELRLRIAGGGASEISKINLDLIRSKFTYCPETGIIFSVRGRPVGTLDCDGYLRVSLFIRGKTSTFRAHRLAWLAINGEWPSLDIDHINGIRTDNRIENLRCVDRSTNNENQRRPVTGNSSGFLGVSWSKEKRLWVAQICVKGKNKNLGRYPTPEEAHSVYLKAKRAMHAGCTI